MPVNANGEREIVASGRSIVAALTAALGPLASGGEESGRSVRVRAEGRTASDLLVELVEAIQDEAGSMRAAIAGIEMEGMVRSDRGLVVWGLVHIGRSAPANHVSLVDEPDTEESGGEITIRARYRWSPVQG
jgi:hypothetical protein